MSSGRFITLEGGEGVGKSTLARGLAEALRAHGREVVLTREPGGSPGADEIRSLLVRGDVARWSAMEEALLFAAARSNHLAQTIRPALARGAWVVCDRFYDSTRAYQVAAGGLDHRALDTLNLLIEAPAPDITLMLDLDPAAGLSRSRGGAFGEDRFERKDAAFHARVRSAFLEIAAAEPSRCVVLDAGQPPEVVLQGALAAIELRTMKAEKAAPEADREPNAPHPRETFSFVGHDAQEAALAEGLTGGRMHHAWLLAGPKGLGKASLAYRFARVALGAKHVGQRPLDVDAEDTVARKIAANAHPDLFILRRGLNERGRPRRDISVDEARALGAFFSLAPSEGGMRVAIIDAVDDLNRNSANAILKTLEEPPARSALLLVCHAPGAALATIRSRCRRLALRPLDDAGVRVALGEDDDAILRLARGRPGRAIALKAQASGASAADLERELDALARGDARRALPSLYEKLSGEPYERFSAAIELAAERARLAGVESGGEAWAEAWSALETLRVEAEDLDMDPRHAIARAVGMLDRAAAARR